jgi:hypothetical protein
LGIKYDPSIGYVHPYRGLVSSFADSGAVSTAWTSTSA